ncbi:helix-turn-helix domain-containing protein [Zavarzinia compransoris]|uniref:AraC family transcriptional regulator n=1 Tax=Zavarzinia compransoris TaxID=1264899 RepID=A0A317EA81_9PROT|nr:AraC family transcriptional regulator [Zavarzinia compransoris]PWR24018.1 AraC family transcriptional regulator [Zavarzinia compransoris]TDP48278.1 AraC family transcriptional regulator [Zavarzinia compransoris]
MSALVPPEDLPEWVPGRILLASDGLGWNHVGLRSYHYAGQDVIVPAMRDYMLVGYRRGATPMQRRFDGRWRQETLTPGAASLLTRAQRAYWNWSEPIDVTHVYLSGGLVAQVAGEVMDCLVTEVTLADVLRTEDEVMTRAIEAIAAEAREKALGGTLYVESVARGLIIHLLRRYASVDTRRLEAGQGLSPGQQRRIAEFIDGHLGEAIDLEAMAAALDLTPCIFARRFRHSFGQPPYAYVIARRIGRAAQLLAQSRRPIKTIAADCGFTDQAHLTRLFARVHGTTPAAFRRQAE